MSEVLLMNLLIYARGAFEVGLIYLVFDEDLTLMLI